jgi:polyferredoxin
VPGTLGGAAATQVAPAAGREVKPQVIPGCPLNSYPARNTDNHDCIMCASCLRACPNGSAQWRLRPPAADLWGNNGASWSELSLMFVLLGAVVLHK